jgi:hypothetical protein
MPTRACEDQFGWISDLGFQAKTDEWRTLLSNRIIAAFWDPRILTRNSKNRLSSFLKSEHIWCICVNFAFFTR